MKQPLKTLIVENCSDYKDSLANGLDPKKYEVIGIFPSMEEAIISIENNQPDLILLSNDLCYERRYFEQEPSSESNLIFVKKKDLFERILIEDLLWIKASGNYIQIYTQHKELFTLSMTLRKFNEQFKHPDLLRVSRSYIINHTRVKSIKGKQLVIGEKSIPFSNVYLPNPEAYWLIIKTI